MHFLYQRLVPTTNGMNLQQTFLEETSERLLSHQTANEHVQLDVLTKKMLPAHQPWVNHPHSHLTETPRHSSPVTQKPCLPDSIPVLCAESRL
jgi:hypothetical protein